MFKILLVSCVAVLLISCNKYSVKEAPKSVVLKEPAKTGQFHVVRNKDELQKNVTNEVGCMPTVVNYAFLPYEESSYNFEITKLPNGFGNDIPLSLFLEQQLPKSIRLFMSSNISLSKVISWEGDGVAWQDNLNAVAKKYGFQFVIDIAENRLLVLDSMDGNEGLFVYERQEVDTVCIPYYKVKRWDFKANQKLSSLVKEWNTLAGWNISWQIDEDAIIKHDGYVIGNILEAIQVVLSKSANEGELRKTVEMTVNDKAKEINIKERKD